MEHFTILLLSLIVRGIFCSEEAIGIGKISGNKQELNIGVNMEANCFDVFEACRKNSECRNALLGLENRCKVVDGRCSAEMVDLPRCGQIMDHLFMYGFPEKKCKCDKNSIECDKISEKIYNNPCFNSIRHLRKVNAFPKEVNAYDEAKGYEATTVSPSSGTSQNGDVIKPGLIGVTKKETTMTFYNEVFGARKSIQFQMKTKSKTSRDVITSNPLGKNKSRRKDNVKRHQRLTNPRFKIGVLTSEKPKLGHNVAQHTTATTVPLTNTMLPKRHTKTSEGRNSELMRENKVFATFEMKDNKGSVKVEIPSEYAWNEEENTDFKAIAIIFGILLGMFMITAIVLIIWTRTKNIFLHKRGKLVQDHSRDEVGDQNYLTSEQYNNNQLHV